MWKCFAISYVFTPIPKNEEISKTGIISYMPKAAYVGDDGQQSIVFSGKSFQINSTEIMTERPLLASEKNLYLEMKKRSRSAQERIISEYICTIILEKIRRYPNDELTFLISDKFQTEKVVGRLGYLGLPMQKLHIMFVSYDLTSFMENHIEQYSVPPKSDLKFLKSGENCEKVWGPYPSDERISMLRTYYCTFEREDMYPVRVNLFAQMFRTDRLNQEKKHIEKNFLDLSVTEPFYVQDEGRTRIIRLPRILIKCEDIINQEKAKYE